MIGHFYSINYICQSVAHCRKEYFRMEKEKGDLLTETMPPEEIGSKGTILMSCLP